MNKLLTTLLLVLAPISSLQAADLTREARIASQIQDAILEGEPVWLQDGLRPGEDLLEALQAYPWLGCDPQKRPEQVRLVLDDPENGSETRPDLPLSFAQRRFAPRRVRTDFVPAPPLREEEELCTSLN